MMIWDTCEEEIKLKKELLKIYQKYIYTMDYKLLMNKIMLIINTL
jgi:hypothetical protein